MWAERCMDAPTNGIFSSPVTSTFTAMRFDENPLTCQCEKWYIFQSCNTSTFTAMRFDENPLTCQCKKRYIFQSCNTSTFTAMRFDENPLTCQCEKRYIFQSCNTSTFTAMRFDENPFTGQCEKEDKKADGLQISHLYRSFASNITAVKGLMSCQPHRVTSGQNVQFGGYPE